MDEVVNHVISSRKTICEILDFRGFDVKSLEHESAEDLIAKSSTALLNDIELELLRIQVKAKDDSDRKAHVFYWMGSVKQKRKSMFPLDDSYDVKKGDDVIILLNEHVHDEFHKIAITRRELENISFFNIRNLVKNPMKHELQPVFRILSPEEIDQLMKKFYLTSKSSLPVIKYHVDFIARVMGLRIGDVVEIERSSETVGKTLYYRVCSI